MAGQPGVYRIDLGSIAAGSSARIAVVVTANGSGPISLLAAATDAGDARPDLSPADNTAYAGAWVAPTVQLVDIEVPSSRVIQLNFDAALAQADAENLAHYQVKAGRGTGSRVSMFRVRSANYVAEIHRVTLRLAHPMPVNTARIQLAMTGFGLSGDSPTTTFQLARKAQVVMQ